MQGGSSVMIWETILYIRIVDLVGIENVDFKYYCQVLQHYFVENTENEIEEDWILQQDNAPVHASNHTKQCSEASDIDVLNWRARSLDLKMLGRSLQGRYNVMCANKMTYLLNRIRSCQLQMRCPQIVFIVCTGLYRRVSFLWWKTKEN